MVDFFLGFAPFVESDGPSGNCTIVLGTVCIWRSVSASAYLPGQGDKLLYNFIPEKGYSARMSFAEVSASLGRGTSVPARSGAEVRGDRAG
jgi:hypothetical protein